MNSDIRIVFSCSADTPHETSNSLDELLVTNANVRVVEDGWGHNSEIGECGEDALVVVFPDSVTAQDVLEQIITAHPNVFRWEIDVDMDEVTDFDTTQPTPEEKKHFRRECKRRSQVETPPDFIPSLEQVETYHLEAIAWAKELRRFCPPVPRLDRKSEPTEADVLALRELLSEGPVK